MQIKEDGFVLSSFESTGRAKKPGRAIGERVSSMRYKRVRRKGWSAGANMRPMLVKIGVCAAACAVVLIMQLLDNDPGNRALSALETALGASEEERADENLGRLRFVELPGMIEVFAPDSPMPLPIEAASVSDGDEGRLLALTADGEQAVLASMSSTVKDAGNDEKLGGYVILRDGGGNELTVSGLTEITVEIGQKLSASDHLGRIKDGGVLSLRLSADGVPEELSKHFRLKNA